VKNIYIIQPYEVGTKKAKSLAMVIPATVVKKKHLSTSTAFALRADDDENELRLYMMEVTSTERNSAFFDKQSREKLE
jgi:antitoxin component of MazEF toxin-antitoxin module